MEGRLAKGQRDNWLDPAQNSNPDLKGGKCRFPDGCRNGDSAIGFGVMSSSSTSNS